jgi:hypothetical protein
LGGPGAVSIKSVSGHVTLYLCFRIMWDLRSRSAFHYVRGVKRDHTIFHARVGPVRI